MSDYIPTTEEVKANFALVGDDEVVNSINGQKFDRWLEQHDAEVAKATEERIIKLIEAQEVEGWFDRGLKQHFIELIKTKNATDFTGSTLPISQEGENNGKNS